MAQGPDQITGRGDERRPRNPLSGLTTQQRERLAVVNGVLDRIYESDEFAEAVARQASGQAEIAYNTLDPNDHNRRPLFEDQIVLNRDGVLYGFHPASARGVDISPQVDVRGNRIITTTVFVIYSEPAGITRIINPIMGGERFVSLLPREALRLLETIATVFSEDVVPTEPQATA